MQRDIWIRVTYEIDTDNGLEITPAKRVEDMVYDNMLEHFGQDEGFCGMDIVIEDSE